MHYTISYYALSFYPACVPAGEYYNILSCIIISYYNMYVLQYLIMYYNTIQLQIRVPAGVVRAGDTERE